MPRSCTPVTRIELPASAVGIILVRYGIIKQHGDTPVQHGPIWGKMMEEFYASVVFRSGQAVVVDGFMFPGGWICPVGLYLSIDVETCDKREAV